MRGTHSKVAAAPVRGGRIAEIIVMSGMVLAALAAGAAMHLHMGLAIGPAVAIAIVLATMLNGTRALLRQSRRLEGLSSEIGRLELEIERMKGRPMSGETRPQFSTRMPDQAPPAAETAKPAPGQLGTAQAEFAAKTQDQKSAVAEANAVLAGDAAGTRPAQGSMLRDAWSFRPAQPRLDMPPPAVTPQKQGPASAPAISPASGSQATDMARMEGARQVSTQSGQDAFTTPALREADVEMIQGLIKKLADDVNATEILQQSSDPPVPQSRPMAEPTTASRPPMSSNELSAAANTAIDHSVDALRRTAGRMGAPPPAARHQADPRATSLRANEPQQSFSAPPMPAAPQLRGTHRPEPPFMAQPASQPTAPSPANVMRSEFLAAINAGRVDVMLEPIIGLGDLRARHFEVSLRLMDQAGDSVEAGPSNPLFNGSGLLPLLDRARLERSAGVARRLDQRGKGGSVFSEFSQESLTDRDFLLGAKAASDANANVAGQLVLSFSQSAVRHLSETQWAAIGVLRTLGFRFAIQDVTDLDMDFERLVREGFVFAKLDADVFLDGLRAPHGIIPASDICRHLAGLGLTLIVGLIDNENERARLHGYGVVFGQGQLFGGPRPMKVDSITRTEHRAA